jgi:pyrimidine operon attenuation protein/uracil phosphoribosyltransferase
MAKTILDKEEMTAAIKRIAKEIVDVNDGGDKLVFIGIMNRGLPLAQRIAKVVESLEKISVPVGSLDVSLHRDDIQRKGSEIEVKESDIPFSIDGKTVVLVDDVIFAGRTIRAAMDSLADYGRAEKIQLAALVDRGHRELPIHPDYIGKKIETAKDDDVVVNVSEIDGVDKAYIK